MVNIFQIFNKIASDWLVSRSNIINGWTSDDIRHLPLLYTQPASSFFKFCKTPPSIQSLIAVDSYKLTDRQVIKFIYWLVLKVII